MQSTTAVVAMPSVDTSVTESGDGPVGNEPIPVALSSKVLADEHTTRSISDQDLRQIWSWNKELPPTISKCIHDIIHDVAQRQPNAIAVSSWDGELTYDEVDDYSSRFARYLIQSGIQIGTRVPICFEKSMWAVVALVGVMKSGATFSLTDPSQPEARLKTIVEQTGAKLVVTSVSQLELGRNMVGNNGNVVAVSRQLIDCLPTQTDLSLPSVPPSTPMYIIFTSGSTGKPKGVIISHENFTSGALPRAEAVGYKPTSRVFDFPSYAFDVSIDCMLCTLTNAGTVCVPSEFERVNDLSGTIRTRRANMVHLTPSVARVLANDIIPSLDVLGLGGEAVSSSDASAWSQHTNLIIGYGPSECTVGCTINNNLQLSTGIGKGVGGTTWITDPENHDVLMSIGEIGELLIEGPVVGVGYLDEAERTAQVFINDPPWLNAGHESVAGRSGRLYKTGDLVRYESNGSGSIEFVGRKDQQVKLRGQRVELAEVEHHAQACLPPGVKVAAEVIKPESSGVPTLVAFLAEPCAEINGDGNQLVDGSSTLRDALATIEERMSNTVPRYMIPSAFITLQSMPSLVSGKTDRKKLREIGANIPRDKLAEAANSQLENKSPATTDVEQKLQQAWNAVLGPASGTIYKSSNFFSLGGDSLRAMKLIAAAREHGLLLTVAVIFANPALSDMATKAETAAETKDVDIAPFSLLGTDWELTLARAEIATLSDVDADAIEDAYPCTPLQEALMALSAKVKEAYVAQRVVDLSTTAEAEELVSAFNSAAQDCAILRTRILQVSGHGLVQAVVKGNIPCRRDATSLDQYLMSDRDEAMDLGTALVRCAIVSPPDATSIKFVLTMHHALYDGWCMPLIVDRVHNAYTGKKLRRPAEFKHFIKHLCEMDRAAAETFWRQQLQGAASAPPQFPLLPYAGYQAQADSLLEEYVTLMRIPEGFTTATVIRAAWAIVAARYMNSDDVIFGETLTGRNAPIVGADEIEGPMITTIPVRVQVDEAIPVNGFLQSVQQKTVAQIPHEHYGLQHIRRLGSDALEACELKTGIVLHPSTETDSFADKTLPANRLVPAGDAEAAQEALKFNTYPLMLVCSIDPSGFLVMASFDSNCVCCEAMQGALSLFKNTAQLLCQGKKNFTVGQLSNNGLETLRNPLPVMIAETLVDFAGATAYIVDAVEPSRLVPLGAVGEIVIESLEDRSLPKLPPQPWSQKPLYKTGKLARMHDGHIQFVKSQSANHSSSVQKRVTATSRRQKKLRGLWSRVLNISEDVIGLNDGFFSLGGDSISAMKLASEMRSQGIKLTVVQMFQKRTLYEMASAMEETGIVEKPEEEEIAPFSLVDEDVVNSVIRPQLADPSADIVNVLPTRPLQQVAVDGTTALPRFSTRYELIHFSDRVNVDRIKYACQQVVSRNEILRTVFVDPGYAVVLQHLDAGFEYRDTNDVEGSARTLCQEDILLDMPLGSSFVKWLLFHSSDRSTLVFKISHAQYDEMCLPIMLQQLSAIYEERPVVESIPFSSYVGHILLRSIPQSKAYWTDLLAGSTMTILKPDIPVVEKQHFAVERTIDISARPPDVTVATIPTASWALCLARRLAVRDVVFGEVVSGRNVDFPNADAVTGPCWQYVPVRVRFDEAWTVGGLLAHVQHQHVASSAHEAMALSEIMDCTTWDRSTTPGWFDSVVHQDVSHVAPPPFRSTKAALETVYPHQEPLREWKIQAYIDGDKLTLEIVTIESWKEYAVDLLADLVAVAESLVAKPHAALFPSIDVD